MKLMMIGALVVALALAGCGGKKESASGSASTPPPVSTPIDPATAASVTGTIHFDGTPPADDEIDMGADPTCKSANPGPVYTQTSVVRDGKVQWAFIYVKKGLEGRGFPAPTTPAVIDQKGCQYAPHVAGVMVNQPIDFLNSDDTIHNVHAMATEGGSFNIGMPVKDMKMTRKFGAPEIMVHVKCDVHNWMSAYVGVLTHPFYAVSDENGSFAIKGLPPGTYTLEAWHERFGTREVEVTLGPAETRTVDFTFKASS